MEANADGEGESDLFVDVFSLLPTCHKEMEYLEKYNHYL
jgi:hypothetical protein